MTHSRRDRKPLLQLEGLETRKLMTTTTSMSSYSVDVLGQAPIPGTQDVIKVEDLTTSTRVYHNNIYVGTNEVTVQRDEILGPTPVTLVAVPGHPGVEAILPPASSGFADEAQAWYEQFTYGKETFGSTTIAQSDAFLLDMTFLTPKAGTSLDINEDIGHAETYPWPDSGLWG